MTSEDFVCALLRDIAVFLLLTAAIVAVVLLSPDWAAGAVAFIGVPAMVVLLVGSVVWDTCRVESRRRDTDSSGADHAHEPPVSSPAAPSGTNGPARTLSSAGRPVRMDVAMAWMDSMWAVHFAVLRSWRRTRPGR